MAISLDNSSVVSEIILQLFLIGMLMLRGRLDSRKRLSYEYTVTLVMSDYILGYLLNTCL